MCLSAAKNRSHPMHKEASQLCKALRESRLAAEHKASIQEELSSQPMRTRSGRVVRSRSQLQAGAEFGQSQQRESSADAAAPQLESKRSTAERRRSPRLSPLREQEAKAGAVAPAAEAKADGKEEKQPAAAAPAENPAVRHPEVADIFSKFARRRGWPLALQLAQHPPAQDTVPKFLRRSVAEAFSIPCAAFLKAWELWESSKDVKHIPAVVAAFSAMMSAQVEMLPLFSTDTASFRKQCKERVDKYVAAVSQDLRAHLERPSSQQPAEPARAAPGAAASQQQPQKPTPQQRKATKLAKRGLFRKAMRALVRSAGLADATTAEVQQELRRLMPVRDEKLPALPAEAPYPVALEKVFRAALQAMQGTSAGPSGMTPEFCLAVWSHELCRKALCTIMAALMQGKLPESLMPTMRAARLIPLKKGPDDWMIRVTLENLPAHLRSSRACVVLLDAQKGTKLAVTESLTPSSDTISFATELKLKGNLYDSNSTISLQVLARPEPVAAVVLQAKDLQPNSSLTLHALPTPDSRHLGYGNLKIRVTAAPKSAGVRPIQCGETLARGAYKSLQAVAGTKLPAAFQHVQLAMGTKGGVEAAYHRVAHSLDHGMAAIDFDWENAYGLQSIWSCFDGLLRIPEAAPFLRAFHATYRQPAPVFVIDAQGRIMDKLACTTGMRQGCVMGGLGFCAGVLKTMEDTLKQVAGAEGVAIADNFTAMGPVEALKPLADYLVAKVQETGGKIRLDKTKTHYFGDKPLSAAEWSEAMGITVNTGTTEYLGGFLGRDLQELKAAAMRKAEAIAADARKLVTPVIPTQVALLLLCNCIPARFAFLARLCPPDVLRDAAKYLDEQVVQIYAQLAGITPAELSPRVRQLLFTPLLLGGRGLCSSAEILARAYLGSQALIAPLLQPALAEERPDSARRTAIAAALQEVKGQIGDELFAELLPVTADTFTAYFAEGSKERAKERTELQQSITAGARAQLEAKLKAEAVSDLDKARLAACQARGSALSVTTVPHSRHLALNNVQVSINERLRLGLKPEPQLPVHCACWTPNGQYAHDPWHGLCCPAERARSVTRRHDDVVLAVARWASRLGARVRIEPRGLDNKSRRRPDILIEIGGHCFMLDVTVYHPLAPSHVASCARREESILEAAEADKHSYYRDLADHIKAEFIPFAVETTGRLSSQAMAFVKILISQAAAFKNVWAPKEIVQGIYRTIAIAIVRGNAEIIASNLRHTRLENWDGLSA